MKAKREISYFGGANFAIETRVHEGQEHRSLVGYAATWDQPSQPLFDFREVVRRGAFTKTLLEGDPLALWNHEPGNVLGRKSAGTLELEEDGVGLRVRIQPPDTQAGRDAVEMIRRGDVKDMSFGFRAVRDRFVNDPELGQVRELQEVELLEVSPVPFPAYLDTSIAVRSKLEALEARGLTVPEPEPKLSGEQVEAEMAPRRRRLEELLKK